MQAVDWDPPSWMQRWEIPLGFSAYCRLHHPVWLSSDPLTQSGPESDKRIVAAEGSPELRRVLDSLPDGATVTRMGPQGVSPSEYPVKWSVLVREALGSFDSNVTVWELHDAKQLPEALPWPNEGNLDAPMLAELTRILGGHTRESKGRAYYTTPPLMFGPPDKPNWHGDLQQVPTMVAAMDGFSPSYLWPDDAAWYVHTNTDCHFTVVACSEDARDEILGSDELDAFDMQRPDGNEPAAGGDLNLL